MEEQRVFFFFYFINSPNLDPDVKGTWGPVLKQKSLYQLQSTQKYEHCGSLSNFRIFHPALA